MKKLLCLFLSMLLIFSLVSCDTGDDSDKKDSKELTISELITLVNQKEQVGYGDNALKVVMNMTANATINGEKNDVVQKIELQMKESGANKIASVTTTVDLPGESDINNVEYFKNGYLYSVVNGVTYKKSTLFEAVTGSASVTSGDANDLIKGAKETKLSAESDGTYKIAVALDPKSDNAFVNDIIAGFGAGSGTQDENITIKELKAEVIISADYFLSGINMNIELSAQLPNAGLVEMVIDVATSAELLGADYEIKVPEGFNIDNAIDINQDEL